MGILISFLYLLLYIAVILLVAALIVWVLRWIGITLDPTVYRIGQAIVALLCLIAIVIWLAGVLGGPRYWPPFGHAESQYPAVGAVIPPAPDIAVPETLGRRNN